MPTGGGAAGIYGSASLQVCKSALYRRSQSKMSLVSLACAAKVRRSGAGREEVRRGHSAQFGKSLQPSREEWQERLQAHGQSIAVGARKEGARVFRAAAATDQGWQSGTVVERG